MNTNTNTCRFTRYFALPIALAGIIYGTHLAPRRPAAELHPLTTAPKAFPHQELGEGLPALGTVCESAWCSPRQS